MSDAQFFKLSHLTARDTGQGFPALANVVREFKETEIERKSFLRDTTMRALATTRIALWDTGVKGIDDAEVRNLPITSISVQRWLDLLRPRFRQIAMARLSEIAAFHHQIEKRKRFARSVSGGD